MKLGLLAIAFLVFGTAPLAAADTPAAERTRTKLFKSKITVDYKNAALREVLKEFAAQAEMQNEKLVMWTYAPEVMGDQKITYSCNGKLLELAMDDVCKQAGIGYIIVSKDDHKHDGWVRITKGLERGYGKYPDSDTAPPPPPDADDPKATERLKAAKTLIDAGETADAKAVLQLILDKHPKSKAAAEAKALLEKLNK
jgi:hypothetical protein